MKKRELLDALKSWRPRSAWDRGVMAYALDLLANLPDDLPEDQQKLVRALLNGADNWGHYSWSGCALAYDGDIAERLCTPSELRQVQSKDGGIRRPNVREEWLDVQARALYQAAIKIKNAAADVRSRQTVPTA